MQVDVPAGGERERLSQVVAAARQLGEAPLEYGFSLVLTRCAEFCDGHAEQTRMPPGRYTAVNPPSTAQTAPVT